VNNASIFPSGPTHEARGRCPTLPMTIWPSSVPHPDPPSTKGVIGNVRYAAIASLETLLLGEERIS